jgi:hypothetical protein
MVGGTDGLTPPSRFPTRMGRPTLVGQHQVKEPTELGGTRRYSWRHVAEALSCEVADQSIVRAFLDTEEVRGSNPLAPTSKRP